MLGIRMQESCYKEAVCFFPSHHIGFSKQLASLFREHILSNWSRVICIVFCKGKYVRLRVTSFNYC